MLQVPCVAHPSLILLVMFITPVLVAYFILGQSQHNYDPTASIIQITLLLSWFLSSLGQVLRPWVFPYTKKLPKIVKVFDQGSILMVVMALLVVLS